MAGFNGKWILKEVNNAAAYADAIKTPEEFKNRLLAISEAVKVNCNAFFQELTVDTAAKTVRRVVFIKGEMKSDTGAIQADVEIDHPSTDGRPAKMKLTFDSDTKITSYEHGDGFNIVAVSELSGDTMTLTTTGNGESLKMTFERAQS